MRISFTQAELDALRTLIAAADAGEWDLDIWTEDGMAAVDSAETKIVRALGAYRPRRRRP